MPTNPTTTSDVAEAKPPVPTDADPTEKFRVDELPGFAAAIGHPVPHIVGAFSGTAGSNKTTIEAAKKRVAQWLKGEAAVDPETVWEA